MAGTPEQTSGQSAPRPPESPRWQLVPLLVTWLTSAVALMAAALVLPGVSVDDFRGALVIAAIVAVLNAVIPPLLAALRLPLTLVFGFVLVLAADALMLQAAADITNGCSRSTTSVGPFSPPSSWPP